MKCLLSSYRLGQSAVEASPVIEGSQEATLVFPGRERLHENESVAVDHQLYVVCFPSYV